jgi:hypothetical protein
LTYVYGVAHKTTAARNPHDQTVVNQLADGLRSRRLGNGKTPAELALCRQQSARFETAEHDLVTQRCTDATDLSLPRPVRLLLTFNRLHVTDAASKNDLSIK